MARESFKDQVAEKEYGIPGPKETKTRKKIASATQQRLGAFSKGNVGAEKKANKKLRKIYMPK